MNYNFFSRNQNIDTITGKGNPTHGFAHRSEIHTDLSGQHVEERNFLGTGNKPKIFKDEPHHKIRQGGSVTNQKYESPHFENSPERYPPNPQHHPSNYKRQDTTSSTDSDSYWAL